MPTQPPLISELKELYDAESSRLQRDFSATKNGLTFLRQRTVLVESIVLRLVEQFFPQKKAGPSGMALVAIGDFGRRSLFAYSEN